MSDLGEQAISKIAEVGLASQLDEVENLDVNVKTDPLKLVSGEVDAVSIQGEGLVMKQELRAEKLQLETTAIGVNPLSVPFGKVELTRPTDATAQIVLTEADINRAFNSNFIQDKLKGLPIQTDGQPMTVDVQQVQFQLPNTQKVALAADLQLQNSDQIKRIAFTAVPQVAENGQCVVLEQVETAQGEDSSPELTDAIVQAARSLLDLRNFELSGMSLRLNRLEVQPGKLLLHGAAQIQQLSLSES